MENGKQPINPINRLVAFDKEKEQFAMGGLTKREYFAAMAMQGLITNPQILRPNLNSVKERTEFSEACLLYADSLLTALDELKKSE